MNNLHNINIIGDKCCGCSLCNAICPTKAIEIKRDQNGFLYPYINDSLCVHCGKCLENCIIANEKKCSKPIKSYGAYLKDKEALERSSSGGLFYELARYVISKGGIVVGCAWEKFSARHICVETLEDIRLLQGSKYVQSETVGIHLKVKEYLENNRMVLFSGTPCQVASIRQIIGDDDNLILIDIVCHGVPSGKLFEDYIEWLEKKKKRIITSYSFRSKKKNNWSLTLGLDIKDKRGRIRHIEEIGSLDPYYYAFIAGKIYRESCYRCPYAQIERVGDITLADFWGVSKVCPSIYNEEGVSAVLINSQKGEQILEAISENILKCEVDILSVQQNNGNLSHPTLRPEERSLIYAEERQFGFDYVAKKYMTTPNYPIELLKNAFSNKTRQKIKRIIGKK